ncbi:MAG: hypothetical protein ACRDRD_13125, partial [Pseudonocardiaceae bacterium]
TLVFETLRRVSYPGMARLRDLGDDPRALVARMLALTCVGGSLVLVPLAASAHPLMNVAFGHRWEPGATVVALGAGSLLLSGPLSVAGAGFLFAEGHAGEALRVVMAHTVIGLVCAAALLPTVGIEGLGIALVVMAVSDLLMVGAAFVRRLPGILPIRILWRPIAVSLVAIAAGAVAAGLIANELVALAASASIAFAVTLAGHWLTNRATLTGLAMTTRRSLRPDS